MAERTDAVKPLMLMILDGWGYNPEKDGNATLEAKLPNMASLLEKYPKTLLKASGKAVGLPEGQMGNSEVGHLNIGAGRVVYQEITRIYKEIEEEKIFANKVLLKAMRRTKETGKALHLLGLLSDGGVHSHIDHLFALLDMAVVQGVERLYLHIILDGRDVLPQSAKTYITQLEKKLKEIGKGEIATVSGRYYTMDRDKRWDRVEKAYKALVYSEGSTAPSALAAVEKSYDMKIVDEFVNPTVIIDDKSNPVSNVQDGDSVIFFNFRADRAREITRAFIDDDFNGFDRPNKPNVHYVCLTQYDVTFECPVAYPPQNLENTLGEVLAGHKKKQLRIAETEKYAHVTFFFNGGVEEPYEGEERVLIPSPKVATYNLKPEMSAVEVTDKLLEKISKEEYDFVVVNFANPDMVGHTGCFDSTVKALETVDTCLGRIAEEMQRKGAPLILTSDHGNSETMLDLETNSPLTAHSTSKVPFIIVDDFYKGKVLRTGGALCDIAPTILEIMSIKIPPQMTGKSLVDTKKDVQG